MAAIEKVMAACNISEQDAQKEIKAANDMLWASDRDIDICDLDDYCYGLGIDLDDVMENPEMLLL